jgi:hypothetical protein
VNGGSFAGAASWITGTVDWPWRTVVLDSSSAGGQVQGPRAPTARQGFVLKTVGSQ